MLTFRCGAARTVFFILFPLAFLVSESYPQITIREKISISPARPEAVQFETPSNQSFLRFTYLRRSEATGRITISGPCGIDTVAESPGNPVTDFSSTVVVIDPAPPGPYIVTVSTVPPGEPISAITVVIENENGFVASRGLAVPGSFQHLHLFFTGYSLSATKDLIEPNQSNRFFAEPVRECIATRFSTSGPLTLRIIEGVEFGQFYRVEFVFFPDFEIIFIPLGTEITSFSSQLQQIDYLADGASPPPGGARIVAQAEWNGVFEADTFFVQGPPAFDHFAVGLEKDTIAFTDTTKVFVQAKDESNNDTGLDGSALLRLSVDSTSYGSFIAANGENVPSPLSNVPYSDAQAGNIRFAAVNKNPNSVVSFKIIAKLQDDTTRTGDTTLVLLEQTLRFVMDQPRFVWPVLPPFTPLNPHADNTTVFEIQLTRGSKPVMNYPIRIKSDYEDGSGGHDHITSRRGSSSIDETFENYGHFVSTQTNQRGNPLVDLTLANGRAAFAYVASRFGDRMVWRAESRDNALLWDTLSIVERVEDLYPLPERSYFDKIGGRCEHHGPSDKSLQEIPLECRSPDNNHWGVPFTIIALDSIAANYRRLFPTDEMIKINDISLPLGGRFDINGQWSGNTYHEFHRFGRDVDIRRTSSLDRNSVVFETICRFFGVVDPNPEDERHYHLYLWRRPQ